MPAPSPASFAGIVDRLPQSLSPASDVHRSEALMAILSQHGVGVRAEQIEGRVSRILHLNLKTGAARLKVPGQIKGITLWKR